MTEREMIAFTRDAKKRGWYRTKAGRRAINRALCGAPDTFQYTPLREGRPRQTRKNHKAVDFNSRPSARGDVQLDGAVYDGTVFQFTPLREGRR